MFIYDEKGIIDEYIPYLLRGLISHLSELVIVVNGFLNNEGREKLLIFTSNLIVRENQGMDVWAYKTGIEFFGWKKLETFDEVIFFNHTIFGPIYPFHEMFDEMDSRKDVDFWGITKHHKVDFDPFHTCKYGYMPAHIQSSFLVIRKRMLASYDFQYFWDSMPLIKTYGDSVGKYEVIFTKDFEEKGYRSSVYINTDDLIQHTWYPLMMMGKELVANRRCPVIKRKSFSQNYNDMLMETAGEATIELYDYINKYTDYDVNLIWDNILRTMNMADIKREMHLNYTLPKEKTLLRKSDNNPKVALFMHLYFPDLLEASYRSACFMPKNADIYITVSSENMKLKVEKIFLDIPNKLKVILIQNRGRDNSSLLVALRSFAYDYDYICFVHDKKSAHVFPHASGESFAYQCFENTIGSRMFIENVITTFEENPRLGMLVPPPPLHTAYYFFGLNGTWGGNVELCRDWMKKLMITVSCDFSQEVVAPMGGMFWFRPKALAPLFSYGFTYEDFPEEPVNVDQTVLHMLERMYGIVPQQMGYYTAWVMNDHFSKIFITNLYFMLQGLNQEAFPIKQTADYLSTKMTLHEFVWTRLSKDRTRFLSYEKTNKMQRLKEIFKDLLPPVMFRLVIKLRRIFLDLKNFSTVK